MERINCSFTIIRFSLLWFRLTHSFLSIALQQQRQRLHQEEWKKRIQNGTSNMFRRRQLTANHLITSRRCAPSSVEVARTVSPFLSTCCSSFLTWPIAGARCRLSSHPPSSLNSLRSWVVVCTHALHGKNRLEEEEEKRNSVAAAFFGYPVINS